MGNTAAASSSLLSQNARLFCSALFYIRSVPKASLPSSPSYDDAGGKTGCRRHMQILRDLEIMAACSYTTTKRVSTIMVIWFDFGKSFVAGTLPVSDVVDISSVLLLFPTRVSSYLLRPYVFFSIPRHPRKRENKRNKQKEVFSLKTSVKSRIGPHWGEMSFLVQSRVNKLAGEIYVPFFFPPNDNDAQTPAAGSDQ